VIDIADLEGMGRPALGVLWAETFRRPVPKGMSQPFLRRFLAFELQARRHGGLSSALSRQIAQAAEPKARPTQPRLQPGARLLREWNGVTHVVEVTQDGFAWRGETWRSLTMITKEITGAHWSGPRFFGLSGKALKK
jgi:hypothetical protein